MVTETPKHQIHVTHRVRPKIVTMLRDCVINAAENQLQDGLI